MRLFGVYRRTTVYRKKDPDPSGLTCFLAVTATVIGFMHSGFPGACVGFVIVLVVWMFSLSLTKR